MTYFLILKSYSDAPDMEDIVEAESKAKAVEFFFKRYGKYGWDKKLLQENTVGEDEMIKPKIGGETV